MKRWFFDWLWQYHGGEWIGWNPIGIEFEYDKCEPAMAFKFVILGVGFQITWLCPWETETSKFMRELSDAMPILTLGPEFTKEEKSDG